MNGKCINRNQLFKVLSMFLGAVVESLERLAVVRKVAGSSPARDQRLENSLCPPSSEWVPD